MFDKINSKKLLESQRLEEKFQDFKPALQESEAVTEANRCIDCYEAPCIRACPTEINIPQFIHRIGSGNTSGAARTILDSNIFGLSCAVSCPTEVLCEGACVYNSLNKKPISIGKLQRFAVEYSYNKGEQFFSPGKPTGKRIALIGAGPASLACAHELRKSGHETVVFEKTPLPGGLNTQGIAPYKMKAATSLREIEKIQEIGVEIQFEKELGRNLDLLKLTYEYDAVFLGFGLGPDSRLDIPGHEHAWSGISSLAKLPRLEGAVEFISHLKISPSQDLLWLDSVKTALIIGGGNTALDACREAKKLGIPRVLVSYRRLEKDMSGYAHEVKAARQEGVEFLFESVPVEYRQGSNQKLEVVLKTPSGNHSVHAELVLEATGQSKLESLLAGVPGLKFENGRLKADPVTGATGNPKVFTGGDLANGGKEVVNAVAEGKRAAKAISKGF